MYSLWYRYCLSNIGFRNLAGTIWVMCQYHPPTYLWIKTWIYCSYVRSHKYKIMLQHTHERICVSVHIHTLNHTHTHSYIQSLATQKCTHVYVCTISGWQKFNIFTMHRHCDIVFAIFLFAHLNLVVRFCFVVYHFKGWQQCRVP